MENTPTPDNAPAPDTSPIVDNYRITITKGDVTTGHWVSGRVNENPTYTFHAKVFDVGSMYGINGGQISKLQVFHRGHQVVDYDRGWDQSGIVMYGDKRTLRTIGRYPDMSLADARKEAKKILVSDHASEKPTPTIADAFEEYERSYGGEHHGERTP